MIAASLSRVQTALTALPFYSVSLNDTINEWFELLVYPDDPFNTNVTPVQTAVSADAKLCSFFAQNDRKTLAKQFVQLVQANGYPEVELKLLQRAYSTIADGQLEAFLHVRPTGVDMGWSVSGFFELEKALEIVPDGAAKQTLSDWYAKIDSNACVKAGRSVGGGYTILQSELPGDSAGESLEYYIDAARTFQVDALPDELLEIIAADFPDAIEIIFHITKTGLIKLGLRIQEPGDNLLQSALVAFGNDAEMEAVAGFEGSLGVERAQAIEFFTDAKGFGAQLFYTPVDRY